MSYIYNDDMMSTVISTGTFTNTDTITVSPYSINNNHTITSSIYDPFVVSNDQGKQLSVKGDVEVDGDITLQGKSLKETLDGIEKRLAILKVNPALEEKWEKLKALGDMYRELEKEIIESEEIYKILKK